MEDQVGGVVAKQIQLTEVRSSGTILEVYTLRNCSLSNYGKLFLTIA